MRDPRDIPIDEYTYLLPEYKIAAHPLEERDASKLLIFQNGLLSEDRYHNIAVHVPAGSLLVFNDTKVINARIRFQKSTGGVIEIFCLEPFDEINDYATVMNKTGSVRWKCFVGGVSKWKEDFLEKEISIATAKIKIRATRLEKISDVFVIQFSWTPSNYTFAEILESLGDIPLPPYIKRDTEPSDTKRYQTIYAAHDGSVAAPTAGLHFTPNIFTELASKNIGVEYITLHVGAGTFKPVKSSTMAGHEMHAEWIDVNIETIKKIIDNKELLIAVGTTSARTLETLYWLGVKALLDPEIPSLELTQWEVYEQTLSAVNVSKEDALSALIKWIQKQNKKGIFTQTQLLITPGYKFRIVQAIVTNFHQPQSTLLLLVAAATAGSWKMMYDYALGNDFRFLSYGDGNLIFID